MSQKQEIIEKYKTHDKDTGSPEVQIALLSERISHLPSISRPTRRTSIRAAAS